MSNQTNSLSTLITLDFRSGVPIYTQIMDQIKQHIVSGILKPGAQLPTVRALALDLRVNFNTVSRAYRLLDEANMISTQQGRGTYILEVPPPAQLEELRKKTLETLARKYLRDVFLLDLSEAEAVQALQNQIDQWKQTGELNDEE